MNRIHTLSFIAIALSVLFYSCKKDDELLEPSDTFVKFYGNSYIDKAYEMIETSDGGFIMAGKTENANAKKQMVVIKIAANGNEEWTKTYSSTIDEEANHIAATSGGYVIASTKTSILGIQNISLTKISTNGTIEWKQNYSAGPIAQATKVITTSDNGLLILGNTNRADTTNNNPAGKFDVLVMKTNNLGDSIWAKQYGGIEDDFGYDIEEKSNNGYILTGSSNSFNKPGQALTNLFVVQLNTVGVESGTNTFGGLLDDVGYEIEVVSDGYIIVGETESNGPGVSNVYLLKIGLDLFTVNYEKYFGESGIDIGNCLTTTSSGDLLIGGKTESTTSAGTFDSYLIKTDASGNELFTQSYGGSGDEEVIDIISLSDNKILMLGTNTVGGNQMISLTKTKENGDLN